MHEPHNVHKIWDIRPSFSLDFWREGILVAIGNKLGSFVGIESQWHAKEDMHCAWIRIELDTRGGMIEKIELVMGD